MNGFRGRILEWAARPWRRAGLVASLVVAMAPAACRRSHVAGTPSTDAVLSAFKGAGFDVSGMGNADADQWGADVCSSGHVSGVDVLICEFTSEPQLAKTEAGAVRDWDALNVDTGLVTHRGRTLLLVADRNKQDPSGRAIGRLVAAFNQLQ